MAGVFLAADLIMWSHSIADIGAGLGTVITNLRVLGVPLLAWLALGMRPHRSLVIAFPVMLGGLALVGGLAAGREQSRGAYSRRRTRIIRQAAGSSSVMVSLKSP
jgi:drug/metabolite transporter (DMT)-like permease